MTDPNQPAPGSYLRFPAAAENQACRGFDG